jgi:hypothetical protein
VVTGNDDNEKAISISDVVQRPRGLAAQVLQDGVPTSLLQGLNIDKLLIVSRLQAVRACGELEACK